MRELYERLIQEGEAGIHRLIDERMQEGVQLDFKQKGDPRRGSFADNDKKILAKAVSGFANSAGGLLVWGVNAKKGSDGIDCAQAPPAPIAQIELFLSEATTLVGQLIQPRHDGIHLHALPSASEPGAGYLLMFIERSERRPHRSEASGQKQYFKRAGDSFFEMEHYDIEDAFNRTTSATLSLELRPAGKNISGAKAVLIHEVRLKNISLVPAKLPYVVIEKISCLTMPGYNQIRESIMRGGDHSRPCFFGDANYVIHPQVSMPFARTEITIENALGRPQILGASSAQDRPMIRATFGCEGARAQTQEIKLRLGELLDS